MSEAPEIHVLDHKVRLLQVADGFRTSLDSVFVAAACPAEDGERILDLGCGVGGAAFCLLWRLPKSHVTGVDIQQDHIDLARRNIALNGREGYAEFACADIRDYRTEHRFDHVICNPPYLEADSYTPSLSERKATALGHHGSDVTLQDWIEAGFHNLVSGGTLTMIHRADYTDRIIQAMGRKFGAVEIIPLWPRAGQEARRVIVRATKDRRTPCRLRAGIILHEKNGDYTDEADAVLREGNAIQR